jgi:putative flippase GtrA
VVLTALWQTYALKFFRYCGVSAFNVVFGQSLLFMFYGIIGWAAWSSNLLAVAISAGPAYWMSRHWVWGQSGSHSVRDEIAPFWAMAVLGLALSTVAVTLAADQWPDRRTAVQLANIAAFGVVWVFKFVFLEKVMWKARGVEAAPLEAAG